MLDLKTRLFWPKSAPFFLICSCLEKAAQQSALISIWYATSKEKRIFCAFDWQYSLFGILVAKGININVKTLPISQRSTRNVDRQMRRSFWIYSKDQGLSSVVEASRDRSLVHREWGGFIKAQVTHQLSRIDVDRALMPTTRAQRPSGIDDTPIARPRNSIISPPFLPITFHRGGQQESCQR